MNVLMPRNKAVRNMRPPFGLAPDVSGVVYLRAATSKLPWKAKMATLKVGTSGHPGNVGFNKLSHERTFGRALEVRKFSKKGSTFPPPFQIPCKDLIDGSVLAKGLDARSKRATTWGFTDALENYMCISVW